MMESLDDEKVCWWHWCRLCARDSNKKVNVFTDGLATTIGKFFWVNIKNDELPQFVCKDCFKLLISLMSFSERVNKAQAFFCMLQNIKKIEELDVFELRSEYGLGAETKWNHIINGEITEEELEFHDENSSVSPIQAEDVDGDDATNKLMERILDEKDSTVPTDEEVVPDLSEKNSEEFEDLVAKRRRKRDCSEESLQLENSDTNANVEVEDSEEIATIHRKQNIKVINQLLQSKAKNFIARTSSRQRKRIHNTTISKSSSDNDTHRCSLDDAVNFPKYECKVCRKAYKNPTSYRKHMSDTHQIKADIPDFICEKCSKIFPTERQLNVHCRSHLPLEDKLVVPCPFCDKKFTLHTVMKQHVSSVHYNEKPYICEQCGQALKTLAALCDHKLVHSSECPFECEICKKSFKNKTRLKTHMDTHTETSYACDECGLRLNTKRTLKMHKLVHSEIKEFKCNFCGAAFKRGKALKNHLILHIGLRPYKCNFCDKTFSNGSNCRSHKKKLHPNELAAEEALGLKTEPINVPKIDQLRISDNISKPRKVGGLKSKVHALLVYAEDGCKSDAAKSSNSKKAKKKDDKIRVEESETVSINEEYDEHSLELHFDEDCEETIVYEVVEEVKI